MARSIWTGVISFGLVSVPVGLYTATRDHDVSFHQFQKGTGDRIRYKRVNERTGREVDYENIVRGAEVGAGEYVMLDQDELDSVAPGRSRSLEVHAFVDMDDIDPIYYQKTYYLAPGSPETAKTYALLRDAMADARRVAIGTLVMRGKEYLAAIRPDDNLLVLETMYFADEVRDPRKELDNLPGKVKLNAAELRMAGQLIDSMTGPWKPGEYRDTYTDRVNELVRAKKRGAEITVAEEAPEPTNVTDLMEVLRRSVENAKKGRSSAAKRTRSSRSAPAAPAAPAKRAGGSSKAGSSRAAASASGMSKSELNDLARRLDVPGRSTMSKAELVKAVGRRRAS